MSCCTPSLLAFTVRYELGVKFKPVFSCTTEVSQVCIATTTYSYCIPHTYDQENFPRNKYLPCEFLSFENGIKDRRRHRSSFVLTRVNNTRRYDSSIYVVDRVARGAHNEYMVGNTLQIIGQHPTSSYSIFSVLF